MKIFKWPFKIFIGLALLSFIIVVFGSHFPTYHSPQKRLKAKQQEAKLALFALYQAEKSFQLEFHTFTTAIHGLGIKCSEKDSYSYGFLLPSQNSEATSLIRIANYDVNKMNCDHTKGSDIETVMSYCSDCTAAKNKFKAIAWTRLPNNKLDIWTIDENKETVNVLNGAAESE